VGFEKPHVARRADRPLPDGGFRPHAQDQSLRPALDYPGDGSRLEAGASVITTASVQAYEPSRILLDCATTKAGILADTKALAKQLIEKGIRANVVAPGPV
jgi:NAD(P)-dependent dehydrogenase (short-subunit alcohol dehydrogenase family)